MIGFFPASRFELTQVRVPTIPQCGACGLYKSCHSPKMEPTGKGKRKILVLGEAPGRTEDMENRQFVGSSGKLLEKVFKKHGVDFRKDCLITNAIICRPPNNATPTEKQIGYCRPNLIKTIKDFNPEIIIPLGGPAMRSLIGYLWKEDVGKITRWLGWQIPCQQLNAWICPTWHPAFLLHGKESQGNEVVEMFFSQHIGDALALEGRPWRKLPDYKSQVRVILNQEEATKAITLMGCFNRPLAFDYETNMLKPDSNLARIVCCSLSDGDTSISFPWEGAARKAMKQILSCEVPKISHNMKFENRWTMKEFGWPVKNLIWDSMQAAHWLDNRSGITSLKFLAFAVLGVDAYDKHVKPYLDALTCNTPNRIHEVDLHELLMYCGMDSLLTYKLSEKQWEISGYDPVAVVLNRKRKERRYHDRLHDGNLARRG